MIDPACGIAGCVGGRAHKLEVVRADRVGPPLTRRRKMARFLLRDQFGNEFCVHRARLGDGEVHDVQKWVRPGEVERFVLDIDALLKCYAEDAERAFDAAELALKHRR